MKFNNIIFDFDGTLVDTKPGIIKAFQAMMGDMGVEPADEKTIGKLIGIPLAQFVEILLETQNFEIVKKGVALFKKYYSEKYIYDNIIYDGVYELLDNLKSDFAGNYIVSNKINIFLNKILEQHDINKFFVLVSGTDGTDIKSKKSNYLCNLIKKNNFDQAKTVIIGDRRDDILAGRYNLIHTIGVTYGYGSREELIEAGAEIIVENTEQLKQILK